MKVFFLHKIETKKAVDFLNFNCFGTIFAKKREYSGVYIIFFSVYAHAWKTAKTNHINHITLSSFFSELSEGKVFFLHKNIFKQMSPTRVFVAG
jgi:hypothetical protein